MEHQFLFVVWITLAIIWYWLQTTLLAKYSRNLNGLIVAIIRNISIMFLGLPLLFRIQPWDIVLIKNNFHLIVLTSFLWAASNILMFIWYNYLPVGISKISKAVANSVSSILISYIILSQDLTFLQIIWICILFSFWALLISWKIDITHLKNNNIWIVISWIFQSLFYYIFKLFTNDLHPFVWAYLLEFGIWAVFLIMIPFLHYSQFHKHLLKVTKKQIVYISLISLTAIIGTIGMGYAVKYWNFALSNILLILNIPLSIILAYFLLHEKVTKNQWIYIIGMIIGLIVLQMR
jgi:drug/metabolite transporter (DMT)-like permease